ASLASCHPPFCLYARPAPVFQQSPRHRKVGHPAESASRRGRREHFLRRGRRSYYAAHLSILHLIVAARNAYSNSGRFTSKLLLREASGARLQRYIPLRKHSRFPAPVNR